MRLNRDFTVAPAIGLLMSILLVLGSVTGCGSSAPRPTPVRGAVTFAGGPCPAPGHVYFLPLPSDAATSLARPGSGAFGVDGRFQATTLAPQDGLFPGVYRVRVECWKEPPNEISNGVSHLPPDYQAVDLVVPDAASTPIELTLAIPGR